MQISILEFLWLPSGGWQVGQNPNHHVKMILDRNQTPFNHKARQITVDDFRTFEYIIGMDNYNIRELNKFAAAVGTDNKIFLLGSYNSNKDERVIYDPFIEEREEDFEKCFEQISSSCDNFLRELLMQY
jgi:protein-tyrosine-phosphatase